jgi:transcriptional regulator with XRE-family HTH domain
MTVQTDSGPVYPDWSFGDRIRKARNVVGLHQRDFAAAIEVTDSSLAKWETDSATPRNMVAIARRIEVLTRIPAAWLLGLDEPAPQPEPPGGIEPPTFSLLAGRFGRKQDTRHRQLSAVG